MMADTQNTQLKHTTALLLGIFVLALLSWPLHLAAQDVTATINGTVTDPSGRVLPNASVTAKSLDRGTVWHAKTNSAGFYNLTRLPVGRYEVEVTAPGFRTAVQSPIELQLNQIEALNIRLAVGRNTQTVHVTSAAPLLQTESTQVSTVIGERANVDLPLATRNYLQLTLLAPGAVTVNPGGFTTGQATGQSERPEINGNRFTTNDYVLDGMDNNQMSDNFVGYAPQPDAIKEFNLITQNAPADFGNYMGGIISVTTKSGTNTMHGSAFEFFRNTVLNANEWANKLQTPVIPRAPIHWNQFGAAVGGPIIRNKLFFFADYEGERFNTPATGSAFTVLTPLERRGDFSQLLAQGVIIRNPLTGKPFPGNVIPKSMLSNSAVSIANSQLYPNPLNTSLINNAEDVSGTYVNVNQGDGRIDWAINDNNHLFARYSQSQTINPTTNSYALAYNTYSNASAWNTVTDYTHTLSTSMVNDARLGVNYVKINSGTYNNGISNPGNTFHIPGLPTSILPAMEFSNNSSVTGVQGSQAAFGNTDPRTVYADTDIQYQDVLNWTHGKHYTQIGFQGWRLRMDASFPGNSGLAGSFTFDGQYSGRAESDFMLGLPSQVQVGNFGPVWGQRGNIFAAFIQDDWQVTHKAVLDLGFRYEDHTPWYEVHNRQDNWDPLTGALELPGKNGNNRALYNPYNGIGNYQPRIGIAYSPWAKTVIRAAYSLSSFMEGTGQGLRLPENPPYSTEALANYDSLAYPKTTLDQGFAPISNLNNPCTLTGLEQASSACYSGNVIRVWSHRVQPAHSNQYSLFVQRELTPTMTFQIGYVGQQARHLVVPEDLSQLVLHSNGKVAPSPFFADNQAVVNQGPLILATYSEAVQNYNGLQTELQARLNHGMSFQLSYTWSHCLTDATGFFGESSSAQQSASQDAWYQNLYNPKADYGSCYYNVTQDFTGYVIYNLPFGRGQKYGSGIGRLENAALGDWRVSAIPTFRGGFPLTLSANDASGTNSLGPRPDCNAPPDVFGDRPSTGAAGPGYQWFSPAPYSQPTSGFGTCSISSVYGPGEQNIDMGVAKVFPIHDTQNLELRGEFMNLFNHPLLNAPNTSIGPTLGVINSSQYARNIQIALKYNF